MRSATTWIRGLVGSLVLAGTAGAQGIYPPPESLPDLRLEVAGTVNAIARYHDGGATWYLIGGDFDLVNGVTRHNLARLNANGALDVTWRADTDGTVNALALAGDRLFVGGEFARVDGEPRGRLARIDADDGVLDPDWSPMANNLVHALQTDGNSVWAAGLFTAVDGSNRRMVARIDADDASLPAFNANFNGSVAFALLLDGNELYIGGAGKVKSTGNQRGLMKVTATSGAAINWNPSIGPQGGSQIRALAADGSTVYAVGRLRRASNTARGNGARFLKSNGALQAWNPGADAEIRALALDPAAGAVFLAGDFLNLAGHRRLARTDATSGAASAGWSANADRGVNALLVNAAQVLVGGSFTQLGAFGAQGGLARLSGASGAVDASFLGDAAGRGTVAGFAFDAGGGVILGGSFDAARQGGESTLYPRANMARLLPGTFELDRNWAVNVVGEVNAVAIAGADLFLGGNFTSVQGTARTRLAKLAAANGALDAAWAPSADAPVRTLVADGAGARLYAAGDFVALGAAARAGLGRLATTGAGAVDAGWDPSPDDVVDALLISASGVYVGGAFGNIGGQNRAGLARLSASTGQADAFKADVDALGAVHALAETADGLYVGGSFSTLAGQSRPGAGRIGAGGVDAWHPDLGGGDVHAIAVDDASGFVYLGGLFASAGGAAHPNLARATIGATGAVEPSWRPGTDGTVVQLALPAGGGLLAAGGFSLATNVMRSGIARFEAQGSDITQIVIDSVTPVGGGGPNTVYGQSYVVGWTISDVSNPGTTPSGSVVVIASTGESCGPAPAFAGGCTLTPAGTGARTLTAMFTGDPLFLDAISAAAPHTVVPATLAIGLSSSPNPSALNASANAQVTLQVAAPGAPDPAGTVVVTVDGGPGCSIVLPATSCQLPAFAAYGFYALQASYTDAANPARHAAIAASATHAVGTLTGVELSVPATATAGVAVTASVVTSAIPDGSSVALSGGNGCTITVAANAGSCQLTFAATGTTPVTASFAGDDELLPSQDHAVVAVDTFATTLQVDIVPAAPFAGQPATIQIVTNLPAGASVAIVGAPGCSSIVLPVTSCATSFPAAGPVTVSANFAGNAQYGPASASDGATVQLNATTLDVTLGPAAPVVGQPVSVTLATNLPNGTAVAVGGAPGCTQIVLPATGCSTAYGGPGQATVSANFAGNPQFAAAGDNASVTIGKAATTFAEFVATPQIGVPNDAITFVWDVDVVAPGLATPTGNVRISLDGDGSAPSCLAPVGTGNCSIVFPDEGSFTMLAEYLGDANLLPALSEPQFVNIQQAAPTDSDLLLTKLVSRSRVDAANQIEQVEFMIVVGNAGPAAVSGAPISDLLPAGLSNATWTCAPDNIGASCSTPAGNGDVALTATLPANTTVTVLVLATVGAAAPEHLYNMASVAVPQGASDPSPANNTSIAHYQTCPASGAALSEHVCGFRDSFEGLP
jgi:uncharacterized repeat protein (TIGR01451 family)